MLDALEEVLCFPAPNPKSGRVALRRGRTGRVALRRDRHKRERVDLTKPKGKQNDEYKANVEGDGSWSVAAVLVHRASGDDHVHDRNRWYDVELHAFRL